MVVLAQEEARLLNHNYIGTEHLLLGLIREGHGVAARALEQLGISLEAVRSRVEEIIGHGGAAPSGHIPFTPRAKKVLELSLREALQLGHNYIGTEHILLGLIREGEGVAAQVLARMGADLSQVRQEVIQLLSGYSAPSESELGPGSRPGGETPAASRALDEARQLAGTGPLGTQDILRAIVGDLNSLGAKALAALGVTPESLQAQLVGLERAGTSDELPEEAGARKLRVEVLEDGVAVVLEDDGVRARLTKALGRDPLVLRSGEPAAAPFPQLWAQLNRSLTNIAARLERDAASRWRPPEFDQRWEVAAYAVVQRPGGATSYLNVAEGLNRDDIRAALAAWLTANQPRNVAGVTYIALLVNRDDAGGYTYRLSRGAMADWPRTQLQYLVAHALVDLTGAEAAAAE